LWAVMVVEVGLGMGRTFHWLRNPADCGTGLYHNPLDCDTLDCASR
jgi:hypothetical protein